MFYRVLFLLTHHETALAPAGFEYGLSLPLRCRSAAAPLPADFENTALPLYGMGAEVKFSQH